MHWLIDYWWIVLLVLIGIIINAVKALNRVDPKSFLDNKPELPPHRDLNAQWDDEDDRSQNNRKK
ncbi:membrane protein [Xenorhabdus vietnamensis]|uniref:Membrane protein n=1 Tax=Xenorhabdus vietnamensis TaxID=351656 RepID=A0A1Y2SDN3_9GAMM|nr:YpfN family protein [Xenorhabdus vietnamensis]OTA16077.1 membrane protein [Xenorhabdus vietnamensis]